MDCFLLAFSFGGFLVWFDLVWTFFETGCLCVGLCRNSDVDHPVLELTSLRSAGSKGKAHLNKHLFTF